MRYGEQDDEAPECHAYDMGNSATIDVSMNNVPFPYPPYEPYSPPQPWGPTPMPYSPPWVPPYSPPYSPPPPFINPNPFGVFPPMIWPPPQEYVPVHPPKPGFGKVTIVVVDENGCVQTEIISAEEWKKLREKKDEQTS